MTPFLTLIERECARFVRYARQTVVPPLVTTIMFILIFGYSLGSRISEISGFSYIIYILPGLIQMGVITNAYANTSTSVFMAKLERSIENLIVSPLNFFQITTAYLIGGMMRGLAVGLVTIISAAFIVDLPLHHYGFILLSLVITSLLFSGLGIISGLQAESWDQIATFTNFIITPLVYLGGVFYSITMLPPFWHQASLFNPIFYSIDLLRYGFLGIHDAPPWQATLVILAMATIVYGLTLFLFWRGYKIIK